MLPSLTQLSWALPLCALLLGCAPKIGNRCTLSTDCSQLGDRLCDTTQLDGYCTIFNCEPDTCPESVCVGFNFKLDPACSQEDALTRPPRFERTFCMKPCGGPGECRDGYACVQPKERSARIVDIVNYRADEQKVCMFNPQGSAQVSSDGGTADAGSSTDAGVCSEKDAGAPWVPYMPDGGMSSASSASGAGGAGGAGGHGGAGGQGGAGGMGGAAAASSSGMGGAGGK